MRMRALSNTPVGRVLIIVAGYLAVGLVVFVSPGRGRPEVATPDAGARRGAVVWRREHCASCHAIYGLGGHLGPDVVDSHTLRGPHFLRNIIRGGAIAMPGFDLSDAEIDDLVAFLAHLDGTGTYPFRSRPLPLFGEVK